MDGWMDGEREGGRREGERERRREGDREREGGRDRETERAVRSPPARILALHDFLSEGGGHATAAPAFADSLPAPAGRAKPDRAGPSSAVTRHGPSRCQAGTLAEVLPSQKCATGPQKCAAGTLCTLVHTLTKSALHKSRQRLLTHWLPPSVVSLSDGHIGPGGRAARVEHPVPVWLRCRRRPPSWRLSTWTRMVT